MQAQIGEGRLKKRCQIAQFRIMAIGAIRRPHSISNTTQCTHTHTHGTCTMDPKHTHTREHNSKSARKLFSFVRSKVDTNGAHSSVGSFSNAELSTNGHRLPLESHWANTRPIGWLFGCSVQCNSNGACQATRLDGAWLTKVATDRVQTRAVSQTTALFEK